MGSLVAWQPVSSRTAGRRARRTWPQRLLISLNVVAIVMALAGAGAIAMAKRTVANVQRSNDIGRSELTPADQLPPGEPQNFLIVGVDDDEGLADDDPVTNGRDRVTQGSVRSDTIMVVRVDPANLDVKVLSFPRDLLVKIPGKGTTRINAALTYGDGNPGLLIKTIEANFGININHYVQVNFAGFKSLVDIIGGVPIWFPTPVRDKHSGLLVENAGCTNLDRNGSLSYARSRYFEYKDAKGRWRSDGASDYGRMRRQQDFLRRVMHRAISKGARNPVVLSKMVDTGVEHITLDPYTTAADLITLGRAFQRFDPDKLGQSSLIVREVFRGGADVLELDEVASEPVLAQFRGTGATGEVEILPSTVTVRVWNGTGVQDQASDITDRFEAVGFQVASPDSTEPVWVTEVRYPPGADAQAHLVVACPFLEEESCSIHLDRPSRSPPQRRRPRRPPRPRPPPPPPLTGQVKPTTRMRNPRCRSRWSKASDRPAKAVPTFPVLRLRVSPAADLDIQTARLVNRRQSRARIGGQQVGGSRVRRLVSSNLRFTRG